jgi:molecular chaperone IbpA
MTRVTTLNLPEFHRSILGMDRLMNDFNRLDNSGYPPYNIESIGEDKYQITLALAGFKRSDLTITVKDGLLTIEGKKDEIEQEGREFIHRGIANRAFQRQWKLAEYVEVVDATMEDGLLFVLLERQVPEEKQPKTIEIK